MSKSLCLLLLGLLSLSRNSFALGEVRYVENHPGPGSFALVGTDTATILVDTNDWPGVIRAAHDLQADIARVTGRTPAIVNDPAAAGKNVVIIGTIGKSGLIDQLIRDKKIEAPEIAGKWESIFIQVVPPPAARRRKRTGHLRQRQARNDLRHLRFVRADRRFAVVFLGGRARASTRTRCM